MTISLDDPRWSGGAPAMYLVVNSLLGTFDGANLAATFEGSFFEPVPGRLGRFRAVRPVTDSLTLGLTLDVRERLGDAANIKTAGAVRASGLMPIRASGRYVKFNWTDAGAWTYAQGLDDDEMEAGGGR